MRSLLESLAIYLIVWSNCGVPEEVQAFVSKSHPSFVVVGSKLHKTSSLTPKFAIIYGADGDIISAEEDTTTNVLESLLAPSLLPPVNLDVVSTQLTTSLLVRLGCAFAPSPYSDGTLYPSDVESATLVSVDATKLEIALAIPSSDGGGLVQVLVPVAFPTRPCQDLEALMDNVQQLDAQAMQLIEDSERLQDNHEEIADQQRILQSLMEEPYADELPDWWTWPQLNIGLEEECKSMKGLLNEDDFAAELRALCRTQSTSTSSGSTGESTTIARAMVAAVGPSGLFLRARMETQINGDPKKYETVDIAIPFPKEATTEDSLRSAILDLVESVDVATEESSQSAILVAVPSPGPEPLVVAGEEGEEIPSPVVASEKLEEEAGEESSTEEAAVAEAPSEENSNAEEEPSAKEEEESFAEVEEEEEETLLPKENPTSDDIAKARKQPKQPELEAKLAARYAAMEDVGERAFAILKDLYMI